MTMYAPAAPLDSTSGRVPTGCTPAAEDRSADCHRVLVVDDDAAFGRTVAEILDDRDLIAVPVTEPQQALDLARKASFAAAVVDLVMPAMDGLELSRELKRRNPDIEIVMLTGQGSISSAIEGIRNEVFDYLQKAGLKTALLRRAVRAAIAKGHLRAENRRLLAGLQESSRKLQTLNEVSARLAGEQHLDRLLAELVGSAKSLLEAEASRAVLMERADLGDMTIRAAVGDGEALIGAHCGTGDGIATTVAETGVGIRLHRAQDHPVFSPRCDDLPTPLPGFLCAPLGVPGLRGALMVAGRARPFSYDDLALLESLARQGAVAIANTRSSEASQNFFTHASDMLVSLLESQDVHYVGHSRAVAALADMVSRPMGLSDEERQTIHFAALLHDIGKLRLGPEILASTQPFDDGDRKLMREHPTRALEILGPISKWNALQPIIHAHHERWDGQGYPRGLAGEAIPLGARIVGIAEAFDAMTRTTPQRHARTPEEAVAELERCAGSQFDPALVRVFVAAYRQNQGLLLV
jgi:putative nucleotidyltransferase with HDIG domain